MQTKLLYSIALIVVFVLGFVIGKMNVQTPVDELIEGAKETYVEIKTEATAEKDKSEITSSGQDEPVPTSATVSSGSLTDSQKKMLESFGVDTEAVTVTATMIACAEAKLGAARLEEIKNGATPSILEGASLLTCYKNE